MLKAAVLSLLIAAAFGPAQAQEFGQGGCMKDALGDMRCPPPNGGITKNMMGDVVCGHGQCMKDTAGDIRCSRQPGGFVTKDPWGGVACTGGCEFGSSHICQRAY
jgi:hypothetical protein